MGFGQGTLLLVEGAAHCLAQSLTWSLVRMLEAMCGRYREVLTVPGWATFATPSGEEELAKKLFPDQEAYKKEEERRFEILEAHWDVPLAEVQPPR